jgi:hypothetical protein
MLRCYLFVYRLLLSYESGHYRAIDASDRALGYLDTFYKMGFSTAFYQRFEGFLILGLIRVQGIKKGASYGRYAFS